MHNRNGFRITFSQIAAPLQCETANVFCVDLIEWTEALRIVGAAEHQPVFRVWILQHLLRYWFEILDLRQRGTGKHQPYSRQRNPCRFFHQFTFPFLLACLFKVCEAFGDFDVSSDWISQKCDGQANRVDTSWLAVELDTQTLQMGSECVHVSNFETDMIQRAAF